MVALILYAEEREPERPKSPESSRFFPESAAVFVEVADDSGHACPRRRFLITQGELPVLRDPSVSPFASVFIAVFNTGVAPPRFLVAAGETGDQMVKRHQ